MLLLSLLAASFLTSCCLHAIHPIVEEEIVDFVSRPEYPQKMEDLDTKMNAELQIRSDKRKHALEERLQRVADAGFKANSLDNTFVADLYEQGRLDGEYYEGDILLTQEQLDALSVKSTSSRAHRHVRGQKKHVSRLPTRKWNTVIPYSFDAEYPAFGKAAIREGIKFWQENTCLRFEEDAEGAERIKFIDGLGCYSYLGRIGREQEISIGTGCANPGIVTHQLVHVFGLFHTQSRQDRNRYVIVNKPSISEGAAHNFDKGSHGELDDMYIPYEYGSNMHFNPYSFTNDQKTPTLVSTDSHFQYSMGGRMPTFYDVLLVNRYYKCFEANCGSEEVKCENGGVQNVNACSECLCPTGYGGPTCAEIDSKFEMFSAEEDDRSLTLVVGNSGNSAAGFIELPEENFSVSLMAGDSDPSLLEVPEEQFYVIQAPPGRRVEVTISAVEVRLRAPDCLYGGAMIWTAKDTRLAGFKFCAKEQTEPRYVSEGERVFFSIWSSYGKTSLNITYGLDYVFEE